tara:strand:- start:197 stop:385 length:189 start_codon:yes stop_codon:yes gene_type:complete
MLAVVAVEHANLEQEEVVVLEEVVMEVDLEVIQETLELITLVAVVVEELQDLVVEVEQVAQV